MRYGVFIVLICSAFSMSSQSVPKNLIGKWTWIETSGGFAGEITILKPKNMRYRLNSLRINYLVSGKINKLLIAKSMLSNPEKAYIPNKRNP